MSTRQSLSVRTMAANDELESFESLDRGTVTACGELKELSAQTFIELSKQDLPEPENWLAVLLEAVSILRSTTQSFKVQITTATN